jgi:hypothetical protein
MEVGLAKSEKVFTSSKAHTLGEAYLPSLGVDVSQDFFLSRKILVHLYKLHITCRGKLKTWHSWPLFTDPETEKVSLFPFSQSTCRGQTSPHGHPPGMESGVQGLPQTRWAQLRLRNHFWY